MSNTGYSKYIEKIGVELEGGWTERRHDLHADESLREADFPDCGCFGELVSAPINNEKELFNFIRDNWPDATSDRCGYHIHFSFKNPGLYALCMETAFYNTFLKVMDDWGKKTNLKSKEFWSRLKGENKYCRKSFEPHRQSMCRTKDEARRGDLRRTHWNFCFSLYGTIECRMLPTFKDVEIAIDATNVLIKFLEDYLDSYEDSAKEYDFVKKDSLEDESVSIKCEEYSVDAPVITKRKKVVKEKKFRPALYNHLLTNIDVKPIGKKSKAPLVDGEIVLTPRKTKIKTVSISELYGSPISKEEMDKKMGDLQKIARSFSSENLSPQPQFHDRWAAAEISAAKI